MRILLTLLFLSMASCFGQIKTITGDYLGYLETGGFTYSLEKDKTFSLSTAGANGLTRTNGYYFIAGDTIFIKSYPLEKQESKHFMHIVDTLIIKGDSCLLTLNGDHDYCKEWVDKKNGYQNRRRLNSRPELYKQNE